jgi:hypothetical protein
MAIGSDLALGPLRKTGPGGRGYVVEASGRLARSERVIGHSPG